MGNEATFNPMTIEVKAPYDFGCRLPRSGIKDADGSLLPAVLEEGSEDCNLRFSLVSGNRFRNGSHYGWQPSSQRHGLVECCKLSEEEKGSQRIKDELHPLGVWTPFI